MLLHEHNFFVLHQIEIIILTVCIDDLVKCMYLIIIIKWERVVSNAFNMNQNFLSVFLSLVSFFLLLSID